MGAVMGASGNRRRKHSKGETERRSLWGCLFRQSTPEEDINRGSFFHNTGEEEDEDYPQDESSRSFVQEIWRRFNFWSLVATILFLLFFALLATATFRMWVPQDLHDIAGYADKGNARDISSLLRNANGAEISFTEAEINRYLRETCRMRQTGFFSIFAHAQGVAVRIHNGYAELVIDRVVGVNMNQTTAVHLTFSQEIVNGKPELRVDFHGGPPLLGSLPRGGSIGRFGIPQRYIQVLKPALETLADCYPDIVETIDTYGYRPVLTKGEGGEESRVTLVPFSPNTY